MTTFLVLLGVVFLGGLVFGAYVLFAAKPSAPVPAPAPPAPPEFERDETWTLQAGEEFAGLTESARCDLVFAAGDLDDERSREMLAHALSDTSDAVALAAAHALERRGEAETIAAFTQAHPGARAQQILDTLALMR